MFRKNESHRQGSLFGGDQLLPSKYRDRLEDSWAHAFRREVFGRIDEGLCAELYSEEPSRPNAPVNVLIGAEILKAGFGWSDRELANEMVFNLQVRHALGLDDLYSEVPELRTLYNFRRRICAHAEQTGTNLFEAVFAQVTDEQLEALALETDWQRMDSTQVLSNLALLSRLELAVAVLQELWACLGPAQQDPWEERLAPYLEGRPRKVGYALKDAELEDHLRRIGEVLLAWAEEELFEGEPAALLERFLGEQFEIRAEKSEPDRAELRPPGEISAQSLQSPHDPEATYRRKGGEDYRGGYVCNVSETCDPDNPLQLITDVQVAPNAVDDARLLARSLEGQTCREIQIEQVTTDGGYTGPTAREACAAHEVELRPTRLRGGKSRADRLGWEAYRWQLDAEGRPVTVECPQGQQVALVPGRGEERFIARFGPEACQGCPLFENGCRVEARRRGPTFYVTRRAIAVARARQQLRPRDRSVRASVEATMRSLKHRLTGSKLPVRGLLRATMSLCASALMVNLRRIWRSAPTLRATTAENDLIEALHRISRPWRLVGRPRMT